MNDILSQKYSILACTALAVVALLQSGCATGAVIDAAGRPRTKKDSSGKIRDTGGGAYYALLPLTIPIDIVTAPIQVFFIGGAIPRM